MGLDMTIDRVERLGDKENTRIWTEFYYWRKCYPVMDWFENRIIGGVENCKFYDVTIDDLRELKVFCERILTEGYSVLDELDRIEWTTDDEIEYWKEIWDGNLRKTVIFLDDFLKNNDNEENVYYIFHGWW